MKSFSIRNHPMIRLSGRFDQRQPLETIFRIIDSVMPIRYEFDGSAWTILPRQ